MNDAEVVYVIMASEGMAEQFERWVHCVCRDSLTAEEACAKMNKADRHTHYYVEEHEVY